MTHDAVAAALAGQEESLRTFGVRSLSLFGSSARGDARPDSDIDLLVEFDGPVTFRKYMGLKLFLEELLGRRVDLATPAMIRPEIRAVVDRDLLRVA